MSSSVSSLSNSEYVTSLLASLTSSTSTTDSSSVTSDDSTTDVGVSAIEQFEALEKSSGVLRFLSSAVGAALLQIQTETGSENHASSLIDRALSEYQKNAAEYSETSETTDSTTTSDTTTTSDSTETTSTTETADTTETTSSTSETTE